MDINKHRKEFEEVLNYEHLKSKPNKRKTYRKLKVYNKLDLLYVNEKGHLDTDTEW